jgi:CRP/FNR family transcriptional regulator
MKIEKVLCEKCGSRDHSLFRFCQAKELTLLDDNKVNNRYKRGQVIFFEGNNPMGLFCISQGTIKVYRTNAEGKEQILRFAGPGDFLGYRALIADEPYSASAETLEEATICYIPKDVFFQTMANEPEMSRQMLKTLCHELGIANERIQHMAQKSVRERLAETLLILQETYQKSRRIATATVGAAEQATNLCLQLPREDIANLTGSSTETIIRLLTEFKDEGLIAFEGKQIRLLNVARVQRVARL